MDIEIGNVTSTCVIGGEDFLLSFDLHKRLREVMRERPLDYHRSPAYQRHVWDGWHYFYTDKTRKFSTGLLPVVIKYLTDWGVAYSVRDVRKNMPVFKAVSTNVGDKTLFAHQTTMVAAINNTVAVGGKSLFFPRGIWDAATNSGKTVAAAALIKSFESPKALFLVNRIELYVQTYKYFKTVFGSVGQIRSGIKDHPDKEWKKPMYDCSGEVVIAMVPTLYRKVDDLNVKKDLKTFNILIVDECEIAISTTYKKVITKVDAGVRLFVSGTPLDMPDKVGKVELLGLSGPVLAKITNQEMIDAGVSRKPFINVYLSHVKTTDFITTYPEEKDRFLYQSTDRISVIHDKLLEYSKKHVLIVYDELAHGRFIYDQLRLYEDLSMSIAVVDGQDADRTMKIEMFLNKHLDVLLTNVILQVGLNMPHVSLVIYAQGGKSKRSVKQWVGRALRLNGFSTNVEIVDFYDIGKYVGEHSEIRLDHYKKEGFDVKLHFDLDKARNMSNRPKLQF